MTRGRVLALCAGLVACDTNPGPDSERDTAPAADPSDLDGDGDGFRTEQGDCDDGDAATYPGAEEVPGNAVDENCDASYLLGQQPSAVATPIRGHQDYGELGSALLLHAPTERVLVSEVAENVGEMGGWGYTSVFDLGAATAAGEPLTVLGGSFDAMSFGQALGAMPRADGGWSWLVGFDKGDARGGVCAWDADLTGELAEPDASSCLPPFTGAYDRVGYGFALEFDADGDGSDDLLYAGTAGTAQDAVAMLRVTYGPLSGDSLAEAPEDWTQALGLTESGSRMQAVGDLTGDGYADLLLPDMKSSALNAESGGVHLIPGGLGDPGGMPAAVGFDGEEFDGNFGMDVQALRGPGGEPEALCVGASTETGVGERAGNVYCFYGPFNGRRASSEADVRLTAETGNTFFGFALAALDADSDGTEELVVGAPDDPYDGWAHPGKVYLYDLLAPDLPLALFIGESGDGLGLTVDAGDVDQDGRDDLLTGAPHAAGGGVLRGEAWLLLGQQGLW